MLKKIFISTLIFIFSFFAFNFNYFVQTSFATCSYTEGSSLGSFLNACKPTKVAGSGNYNVETGFKTQLLKWIKNISLVLGVLAVGSIVYSGMLLQLSAGEDDKIKKAKGIFKWTLIGFLGLISASGVITIVINLFFALAS